MGRGPAAALVAVLALTGCAQVQRMPTDPISVDEYLAIQHGYADLMWASTGLPDELRPPNPAPEFITVNEWGAAYAGCMNAAGFDNYTSQGDGVVYSQSDGQPSDAETVAKYTCDLQVAVSPEESGILSSAQLQYTYDYYQQALVPCLRVHGVELDAVPTREEYLEGPSGWNPYWTTFDGNYSRIMAATDLRRDCPPDPPGALYSTFGD